ncbi:MAG: transposase [bacterium]
MPRPTRVEFPGALYFISTQTMPGQTLFQDDIDRRRLLEILDNAVRRYGLLLHAFTLLDDGYRLLVETPNGNLTKMMQYVNSHYTAYTNTRRHANAQLFKGRYLSTVVDKPRYLLKLCRYIHLLPVHRKLAERPASYPWSSHSKYVLPNDQPPMIYSKDILDRFEGQPRRVRLRFQQVVESGIGSDLTAMTQLLKKTRILGSPGFAEKMKVSIEKPVPESIDTKLIVREAAKFYNASEESVVDNRTKPNPARNAAIYLCRNMTDTPLEKLGSLFDVGPSSICNTAKRVEAHKRSEEAMNKELRQIEMNVRSAI